jgi:hypothetical protein
MQVSDLNIITKTLLKEIFKEEIPVNCDSAFYTSQKSFPEVEIALNSSSSQATLSKSAL